MTQYRQFILFFLSIHTTEIILKTFVTSVSKIVINLVDVRGASREEDPGPRRQASNQVILIIYHFQEPTMQVLQVREKLSTVSQSISEIEMKMFSLSAQSKSEFLLAVSTIIKQLEYLVFNNFVNDKIVIDVSNDSMKWDNIFDYPEYCDESSSLNSSIFDAPFMSSSSSIDEERNVMSSIRKDKEDKLIATTNMDEDVKIIASSKKEKDVKFISNMVNFIYKSSPGLIYSRSKANRRRKRKIQKSIVRELLPIWNNVTDIVSPRSSTNSDPSQSPTYPRVDWKTVKKRFLSKLPLPTPQPCQGCSNDPAFYKTVYERTEYGYHRNMGSKFSKPNPFGAVSDYLTDVKVIAEPNEVFHGHVYQDQWCAVWKFIL